MRLERREIFIEKYRKNAVKKIYSDYEKMDAVEGEEIQSEVEIEKVEVEKVEKIEVEKRERGGEEDAGASRCERS